MNGHISKLIFGCMIVLLSSCSLFPVEVNERLAHFYSESPVVNRLAPDFKLKNVNGETIKLSSLVGDKPIVLQFGSYTCPVFRYRRWDMADLYRHYKDQVNFLLVYTIEAHPKGSDSPYFGKEYRTWWNILTGADFAQAASFEERFQQANATVDSFDIPYSVVVDTMDNRVWKSYGRVPSAAFVINRQGKVVLKQPWVVPKGIAAKLDELLGMPDIL